MIVATIKQSFRIEFLATGGKARASARNEGGLRRFLLRSGVSILFPDEQTTHHHAAAFRQLRQQGTPIPTNALWIAALVMQHQLVLCSRDAHFDHLPQILRT
jgi:predicted nucleic acid-binding protein